MKKNCWILAILTILFLAACHNGRSEKKEIKNSLNGYWSIYASPDGSEENVNHWLVEQSGTTLSLKGYCPHDDDWTATGTIIESDVTISLTYEDGEKLSISGAFNGENAMSGNYTSTAGHSGSWRAERASDPECINGYWSIYASPDGPEENVNHWLIEQSGTTLSLKGYCPHDDDWTATGTIIESDVTISLTYEDGEKLSISGAFNGENAMSGNYTSTAGHDGPWRAERAPATECP